MMKVIYSKPQVKTIQIDGLGSVTLRRDHRARRLTLKVKPDQQITLTVPYSISEKTALAFLEANREWALKNIQALKEVKPPIFIIEDKQTIQTRTHRLALQPTSGDEIRVGIQPGIINVQYPSNQKITNPRIQEAIKLGLTAAYRIEAKQFLPPRVRDLAQRYGFRYNRLYIKNLKSRWGSCSAANNINLNLHLMRLPDELIDYVILHELTHTNIKNHSRLFWQELERILPDAKVRRQQLKTITVQGFLPSVVMEN